MLEDTWTVRKWGGPVQYENSKSGSDLMMLPADLVLVEDPDFKKICEEFGKNINRHISVYGADNNQRLTGLHETQSIDKFSYGVSDRGASIRIPVSTIQDGWKGRLEDRRPASNGDPYKIAAAIIKTTKEALSA